MTEKTNLTAALELAAVGLPVFPVHVAYNSMTLKFDKHPCIKGWQTKATAAEAAIHEFWRMFPSAAHGLALGQARLVVLDADRHGGPDGVSAFHDLAARHGLPEGVVRIDTAGSGEHWVFRNLTDDPLGNGEGVLRGGINMRGHGGFIVAPGALRPDGQRWCEPGDGLRLASSYAAGTVPEIPQWLVDLIRLPNTGRGPSEGSASSSNNQKATGREQTYAARALEGECTRVAQAASGSRNETLNKAAFALGTMAGADWIEPDLIRSRLFAAAQECGLVRDDGADAAQGTIESGLKAGMAEPRPPLPPGRSGTNGTHHGGVWPEVDPCYLGSGRSDPAPFPIDLLGPFWGSWCQAHAEARCVPVDYVSVPCGSKPMAGGLIPSIGRSTRSRSSSRTCPLRCLAAFSPTSSG
jgi:Bifunctional DNA primase/polymerase, N-terminal